MDKINKKFKKLEAGIANITGSNLEILDVLSDFYSLKVMCLDDLELLKVYNEKLLEKFKHIHVNNGVDDSCKECGFDLRNKIHAVKM